MSKRYTQNVVPSGVTRFNRAPMSDVEFSKMSNPKRHTTTFNAGNIVPIYYAEVLPHDTFSIDMDCVIRQTTSLFPVMGQMLLDVYAFFVPNRIINESWKNAMGENTSGYWSAPQVSLVPLVNVGMPQATSGVRVPVCSVADYYGFPTQSTIHGSVLTQCNDLKFRGYLEIYNTKFRDQNYQPPIPYSKLNIQNNFFAPLGESDSVFTLTNPVGGENNYTVSGDILSDGSYPDGAINKAIYGEGKSIIDGSITIPPRVTTWSALKAPLKANKLHDVFTSALPSPQKGAEVYFSLGDVAEVNTAQTLHDIDFNLKIAGEDMPTDGLHSLLVDPLGGVQVSSASTTSTNANYVSKTNLIADLSSATGITVNDLRTSIATQQVLEILARGGSRYIEQISSFFGIETENPFSDIPVTLGHIRRELDLYQVAQTSPSEENSTPQGNLSAFGYTNSGGHLLYKTFLEHGYIHVFAIVRQKNQYSTFFAPDNFRLNTMDFYLPPLANIGEQPMRKALLNPFQEDSMSEVLGYQEAWWEYRHEVDSTSGYMRSGINGSLDSWTYSDNFDSNFTHVNGDWLKSNAQEVLDRTIATTSDIAPQLFGQFIFKITKQRPMPVYSVPGLDVL